jgi:hypothetical protein
MPLNSLDGRQRLERVENLDIAATHVVHVPGDEDKTMHGRGGGEGFVSLFFVLGADSATVAY